MENAVVHGKKLEPFTWFYPVQKWTKLLRKIQLECPLDEDGNNLTTTSKKVKAGTFKGFINHFHVTKSKIDCAGLDIKKLLNEIK